MENKEIGFGKIGIRMFVDPVTAGLNVHILQEREDGYYYATKIESGVITFEKHEPGCFVEPLLRFEYFLGQEFLKSLSSSLIEAGFRDKSITKDGEIKRMENHLSDIRRLLFHKEKID